MQEKEINALREEFKDELSYESLKKMVYVDQINEALRKFPTGPLSARFAIEDYEYDDDEKKLEIPKETRVFMIIYGVHHDAEYYPNRSIFSRRNSEASIE